MSAATPRVTFVVHAPTRATAAAAFPDGEPLDDRGSLLARELRGRGPRAEHRRHAPDPASTATCAQVVGDGRPDPGLRDWDLGRWAGRTLDDLVASDPDAVREWLDVPSAMPHGGESLLDLIDRTRGWLGDRPPGHTVAVCGSAVVRAAVVIAIGAPASGFWRVDAGPLTETDLRGGPARWTVRATGRPVAGTCRRRPARP